jgi:hypothetical protein
MDQVKIKSKNGIFRFFRGNLIVTFDNSLPIYITRIESPEYYSLSEKEYLCYQQYFTVRKVDKLRKI